MDSLRSSPNQTHPLPRDPLPRPAELKTPRLCISFLRKGGVLADFGRVHNLKDPKEGLHNLKGLKKS